jgi:hypothetical protein
MHSSRCSCGSTRSRVAPVGAEAIEGRSHTRQLYEMLTFSDK